MGHHGLGYGRSYVSVHRGYGHYLGKRSAEAEPEADAGYLWRLWWIRRILWRIWWIRSWTWIRRLWPCLGLDIQRFSCQLPSIKSFHPETAKLQSNQKTF